MYRSPEKSITIKELKHDGKGFILHPLNPAYEDVPALGTCLGYLVGIVREVGSRKVTVYDSTGIRP
jgi:SOS-response transcriptional repressor LexA